MAQLTAVAFAFALTGVTAGAVVQGSIGFGFALVVVPALSFIRPEAIPVTILLLALPMTLSMAVRERRHIDMAGTAWILLGRVPGTALGVWILATVPPGSFTILVGAFVLMAVAFSIFGPGILLRGRTKVVAGALSGVMGTSVGIGGPPLALIYQNRPGPELRSTLALSFFSGLVLSITALGVAGKIEAWHAVLALKLLPALVIGLWVSRLVARFLDERWLRPAVLAFAGISGAVAVARGLVG